MNSGRRFHEKRPKDCIHYSLCSIVQQVLFLHHGYVNDVGMAMVDSETYQDM